MKSVLEIDSILKSNKIVVVDFWAEWCGPCRMMNPILERIGEEYGDKIKIAKVNADDSSDLTDKYEIMSLPSFLLFKDGKLVDKIIGAMSEQNFKNIIDKIIGA